MLEYHGENFSTTESRHGIDSHLIGETLVFDVIKEV